MHSYTRLKEKRNEGGFTLIELLIVIVILGILAAVVVFSVGGITDRGSTSACKSTSEQLNTASEAYRAVNGNYPAAFTDISPAFINTSASTVTTAGNTTTVQDRATNPQWQVTITFAPVAAPALNGLPTVARALPTGGNATANDCV